MFHGPFVFGPIVGATTAIFWGKRILPLLFYFLVSFCRDWGNGFRGGEAKAPASEAGTAVELCNVEAINETKKK